jgi:hypothetical protein
MTKGSLKFGLVNEYPIRPAAGRPGRGSLFPFLLFGILLSVAGFAGVTLAGSPEGAVLAIDSTHQDAGEVFVGEQIVQVYTIHNTGTAPLRLSEGKVPPEHSHKVKKMSSAANYYPADSAVRALAGSYRPQSLTLLPSRASSVNHLSAAGEPRGAVLAAPS